MKTITKLLLLIFLFGSNTLFAQLQGSFSYAQDGHIYFCLVNSTPYSISVSWGVINYDKDEHRQDYGTMPPNSNFIYGPNESWVWERGEVFYVTYANGQTAKWTCPETDPALRNNSNVSFKGKHCTGSVGCNCPGFKAKTDGDVWQTAYCKNCGHHKDYHK